MPSTLTWLDQDEDARVRSLGILALFQEKESRDELGIGAIRDSIADRLFPGTTTIQTRLRYMLIIPWMYQRLEGERVPASQFDARARQDELALTQPLMESGADGVFGRVARGGLKRLPSSVYWAGLGTWRIRRFQGTQMDYYRCVDALYVRRDCPRRREDDDSEPDRATLTWHPRLPPAPAGFPGKLDLKVTRDEASFLVDQIQTACPVSLLGWLASYGRPDRAGVPWEHTQQADFPEPMRVLLHHAHLFADIVEGAARLYNIALARQRGVEALADYHCAALDSWRERIDWSALTSWSLDAFWSEVVTSGHTITASTRRFVTAWVDRACATKGAVADDVTALDIIRQRERALKGPHSRFDNRGALNQWSGSSATSRLAYRWPITRRFLDDLYPALDRK